MNTDKIEPNKILQKNSSRHHYIPRFLLDGFKNSEGLLYVYDKKENKILKNPRPPKAIFFEQDRNTVALKDGFQSSFIEDLHYSKIDDESSKIVKLFQNEQLNKIEFSTEETAKFLFFLITLFWRIPSTDYAAAEVLKRSKISFLNINPAILLNDPTFGKMERAMLFKHHIDEMKKKGKKGTTSINIHSFSEGAFLIGDNPILFKKTPKLFSEFNDIDFMIALSSTRLYSSTHDKLENVSRMNAVRYNTAIIHQATRYIACANFELLQQAIEFYNSLKNLGDMNAFTERAFNTN